jgi:hypothetical protein
MIRRLATVAASVCVLLTSSLSHAQARTGFGERGQFIVSADRLMPLFSFTHVSQDQQPLAPGTKTVTTYNEAAISLLWGSSSPDDGSAPPQTSFFTVPRVGFDYVIAPNVTVGGDLIIFFTLAGNSGIDTTPNGGATSTVSTGNPSSFIFGIAPRGGYILRLTDLFSLWLRGGVSYYVATSKTSATGPTVTTSANQFALDLDPQLVITPIPHLGVTLGLTADLPVAGGHSVDTQNNNVSASTSASSSVLFFGITTGLLAYF